MHVHGSTRRLYRLVESGKASIQQVTFCRDGGRWWVSIAVRLAAPVVKPRRKTRGDVVGVDVGLRHLATLSCPVEGLTDQHGHVPNPRCCRTSCAGCGSSTVALARAENVVRRTTGSSSQRRARLHGSVARTRHLLLHRLTRELAATFDAVVVEDLNVAGMTNRRRRLGRSWRMLASPSCVGQLAYKTPEHGHQLVVVDRWFPSSKTCSSCSSVKAKLELWERTYTCSSCGHIIDRDLNAARNLEAEGRKILAGLRPERRNGDPRPGKTASFGWRHRPPEGTTPPSASAGCQTGTGCRQRHPDGQQDSAGVPTRTHTCCRT